MVLLLKGPRCMFISKIAAYSSETLIRSSVGPSVKKGVSNSIPVTQALRSRESQGRQQSLSLSPPPQVCNQNMLIPLNFKKNFGKAIYGETNNLVMTSKLFWGRVSTHVKHWFLCTLFDKLHKENHPIHLFSLLLLAEFRSADGLPSLSNRITFHLVEILYIYTCMYSVYKVSSHETKLCHYVFLRSETPIWLYYEELFFKCFDCRGFTWYS